MKSTAQLSLYFISAICLSGCHKLTMPELHQKYGQSTQGAEIDHESINQVAIGMYKAEVASILGNPHINPAQPEVWTYIHLVSGRVTDVAYQLTFSHNKVVEISSISGGQATTLKKHAAHSNVSTKLKKQKSKKA